MKLLHVILVFLAVLFAYFSYSLGRQSQKGGHGPLLVEEQYLDLGEITAVEKYQFSIPLKNISSEELAISNISPGCRCSSVKPTQFVLKPLESRQISVITDLLPVTPEDMSRAYTDRNLVFRVSYSEQSQKNISPEPFVVRVNLRAMSPFHLSASNLIMNGLYGDIDETGFDLKVIPNGEVSDLKVSTSSDVVTATIDEEQMTVRVVPNSELEVGNHHCVLLVSGRSPDHPTPFELKSDVTLRIAPGIKIEQLSNIPNKVNLNSVLESNLSLTSLNGQDFLVTIMEAEQDLGEMHIVFPDDTPNSPVSTLPVKLIISHQKEGFNSCFVKFTIRQGDIEYDVRHLFHFRCE